MAKPEHISFTFWHDPRTVADRLRWAKCHWQRDNRQPRDLDQLMDRAADTLDNTVPSAWRLIAVVQSIVLIGLSIWMGYQ